MTLIWLAVVVDGAITSWTLVEDTDDNRQKYGLAEQNLR
jgi:hypothetical protein